MQGAEHGITSDGFFDLETQPKKAVVLGAGYIAVEMAGILHGLGTETHLCFRGETVLRRGFDAFIVETLMAHMAAHGPILKPGSTPARVDKDPRYSLSTFSRVKFPWTICRLRVLTDQMMEIDRTGLMTVTFEDGSKIAGVDCVLFAT